MLRLNIWSSPRNISTAFMYSWAQRADTTVVDEPLYAHYLTHTDTEAAHPATAEILATMECDGSKVVEDMLCGMYPTPVVLFKQMTHHLIELDRSFLAYMDHVLLIRDPRKIIHSYAKVIPNPSIQDVGVKAQFELYQELQDLGRLKAVIDTRLLLLNPEGVLRQLCERLNLEFDPAMLQWDAGARPEDGVWAKYWYHTVHQSTGFTPYIHQHIELPAPLEELAKECQPYYEALLARALM